MSEIVIIIISLAIIVASYIIFSIKEGSFLNVLTLTFIFIVPAHYICDLIYTIYFGLAGSLYAYCYVYLSYAMQFGLFAISYLCFPEKILRLHFSRDFINISWIPYFLIFLAVVLYLPILWEYRDIIFSPREIYTQTRIGYGLYYFTSTTLCYLAVILILFKKPSFRGEKIIATLFILLLLLLHGSKGQISILIFIFLLYRVYVDGRKVPFIAFLVGGLLFTTIILGLFYLTFPERMRDNIIISIAGYSDYTRNVMMVIDSDIDTQFGRLTFENEFFSRIPRLLYPDKPKDFGAFYLAKIFYPEWFEAERGLPFFFGMALLYADFRGFAFIVMAICSIISGIACKIFKTRVTTFKTPSDFIMLIFLSGMSLIPTGAGYLLPENFLLAAVISLFGTFCYKLNKIVAMAAKPN